jgi:flagellar biosynthetic protein FlhB
MSEKTEKPTAKRRNKARREGNVAKSAEFTGAMVMLFAWAALSAWMTVIVGRSAGLILNAVELVAGRNPTRADIGPFLLAALSEMGLMIAPPLALAFIAAAFFNYVQIGAVFTLQPLMPQGKRLNPASGFKNIFAPKKAVDLAKNVAKLSVSGVLGYMVIRDKLAVIIELPRLTLWKGLIILADIVFDLCMYLGGALVVFGVADLFWQRHQHEKGLMMGKDEVKREYKESEGDQQVKGERKKLNRELLRGGGAKQVKNADAVVVNPTHVAVALRYDQSAGGAPKVLSAGRGELAREIKRLARRYDVPIVKNVDLARALVDCEIDSEIPPEFYEPVAELLTYAYKLRREKQT